MNSKFITLCHAFKGTILTLPTNSTSNSSSICYYHLHGVGSLYWASCSYGHCKIKEVMGAS